MVIKRSNWMIRIIILSMLLLLLFSAVILFGFILIAFRAVGYYQTVAEQNEW